jgi:hypothetical protein
MALVRAGVGSGFTNTQELHGMKHDKAMKERFVTMRFTPWVQ